MSDSTVAHIDQIAASDLARDLNLSLSSDKMLELSRRLAVHRTATIDMAVSRIQTKVSDSVLHLLRGAQSYRSSDWADGCRAAEALMLGITSSTLSELRPREARSKGQILRDMLRNARKRAAADPKYHIVVAATQ